MKNKFIYSALFLTVLVFSMTSCGGNGGASVAEDEHGHHHSHGDKEVTEVEVTEAQLKTVGIELGKIEYRELGDVIRANGQLAVNPQDEADVAPLSAGIIKRITVTEGQHVKAGQVVAYQENAEVLQIQQDYLTAVDECNLAQQEYDRQQALAAQGAGVRKNLQQATSALGIAQAKKDALQGRLAQLGIDAGSVSTTKLYSQVPVKAPISGVVAKINLRTGSYADMSSPVMTMVNNSGVFANLQVYEKDLNSLKVGQAVELRLTNNTSMVIDGKISEITQALDPVTKTLNARVALVATDKSALIPGMGVTALISTGESSVMALPDESIAAIDGKNYIFVLEDVHEEEGGKAYHFDLVPVLTGAKELGFTQITPEEELPADATVVVGNAFYLASMAADHGEHNH